MWWKFLQETVFLDLQLCFNSSVDLTSIEHGSRTACWTTQKHVTLCNDFERPRFYAEDVAPLRNGDFGWCAFYGLHVLGHIARAELTQLKLGC